MMRRTLFQALQIIDKSINENIKYLTNLFLRVTVRF